LIGLGERTGVVREERFEIEVDETSQARSIARRFALGVSGLGNSGLSD
jgi:hypothetical protein